MTQTEQGEIDYTQELEQIKARYGKRYYLNPKAREEAAALWGIEANNCGVPVNMTTEPLINEKGFCAEITFSCTLKNQWLIGISAHSPMGGIGYAPSVWDRTGFTSYVAARKAGIRHLKDYFNNNTTTSTEAKQLILRKLADKEFQQLDLF